MTNRTCAECKQPLDTKAPYYWGRLGGEWHPDCYAKAYWRGGMVMTGMWRNTNGLGDPPEGLKLERSPESTQELNDSIRMLISTMRARA